MKPIFVLISLFFFTLPGCEYSSHDIHPNCNDGIKNGNETGVDCGGDCVRCWECGHYCELIAGESSHDDLYFKHWISVPPDAGSFGGIVWEEYYIYNTGKIMRIGEYTWDDDNLPDTTYGFWTFDDPSWPKEIGFSWSQSKPKSLDVYYFHPIILLKTDSLMWDTNYPGPRLNYFLLLSKHK